MIWIWALLATLSAAINIEELVGTWTTKSREVITGPVCEQKQRRQKKDTDDDRVSTIRSMTNCLNPT